MAESNPHPESQSIPKFHIPTSIPKLDSDTIASAIPIPTLEENAPTTSKLRSNLFLLSLLLGAIISAYLYGFELLQPSDHTTWAEKGITLFLVAAFGGGAAWFVGVQKIDWWELVWGYWWFSMPIAGGAAVVLVRAMEATEGIEVKD